MFDLFPGYNATPMTELAMQLPMYAHATPYALDWNSDGVLDLWHHNHYVFSKAKSRWSDPSVEKRGNLGKAPGGCMVDWDAIFRDGDDGSYHSEKFVKWTDKKRKRYCFDVHSTTYLDINGDGYKDLFLITGGGRGTGNSSEADHVLFWGEPEKSKLGFRLVGGGETAFAAGIHGRSNQGNERGRHQYWLDLDSDGRLDLITLNGERNDEIAIPGNLYHNMNGESFRKVKSGRKGFAEFALTALLIDLDGDGKAHELVVPSYCDEGSSNWVCKRAPRGTLTVYARDLSSRLLVRRDAVKPFFDKDTVAKSMASGDYDFDGLADMAILWKERITFHLSSARQKKCERFKAKLKRRACLLKIGAPDAELKLGNCGTRGAVGMRMADFNLDGRIDILVTCTDPGKHAIYELKRDGSWTRLEGEKGRAAHLGVLNSKEEPMGKKGFCNGVPTVKGKTLLPSDFCEDYFSARECRKVQNSVQFAICSNRKQTPPGKPLVYVLGATVADIDNDGFVDVITSHRFGSSVMLRNTLGDKSPKRFLAVRLDRTAGEAATIGAIIKLEAARMGPYHNETTTQMHVVTSLSHETECDGGREDREIFGLGQRGKVHKITVQWPHCCDDTVILDRDAKFLKWYNNMGKPYDVPAPKKCDKSCWEDLYIKEKEA